MIVCADGIPEATALSVFAPVMIFITSKNSDKWQFSATCLVNAESVKSRLVSSDAINGIWQHLATIEAESGR